MTKLKQLVIACVISSLAVIISAIALIISLSQSKFSHTPFIVIFICTIVVLTCMISSYYKEKKKEHRK